MPGEGDLMMGRKWVLATVAGVAVCALAAAALAVAVEGAVPAEKARRVDKEPQAKYARMRLGRTAASVMDAAVRLPAAEEALAKYREQAMPLERQLGQLQQKCMQEIRQAVGEGGDPAKAKEIAEKYKGEMLPILEKLTEARLALCDELLRVAKTEPKAVAATTADQWVERMTRLRMKALRDRPVKEGARRERLEKKRRQAEEGNVKEGDVKF